MVRRVGKQIRPGIVLRAQLRFRHLTTYTNGTRDHTQRNRDFVGSVQIAQVNAILVTIVKIHQHGSLTLSCLKYAAKV